MYVKNWFYKSADLKIKPNAMIIKETKQRRDEYMSEVFFELYKEEIAQFKPKGKAALLYCAGSAEHHSCARIFPRDIQKANIVVKSHTSYIASKVAKRVGNIEYLSINANACASSMYALHEAKMLLDWGGFDEVIIYGEEWVEDVELLLFEQLNIEIVCSDGFFMLHLTNDPKGHKGHIKSPTWIYSDSKSAFEVTKEGYMSAMSPFVGHKIDAVKMHGTSTKQNNDAEHSAVKELFGQIETIGYKEQIGHSQGCSTGVEICMLLEQFKDKKIVVNASGLGNFYGSCLLAL